MKYLNKLTLICLAAALTILPFKLSLADDDEANKDLPVVTGEIKKVKPKSGKITIKHEPIPNLDMPGMTMVFRTDEDTDISEFEKGDNVEFTVIEKDGKFYIVKIDAAE